MFVLDTNVLSEVVNPQPDPRVALWLRAQRPASVFTTTVCQAEILSGLAIMPPGTRRSKLLEASNAMFSHMFRNRLLGFDSASAVEYADVFAARRRVGKPVDMPDTMIAAIARAHQATIVTRNVRDFEGCGVEVVNPWDARVT